MILTQEEFKEIWHQTFALHLAQHPGYSVSDYAKWADCGEGTARKYLDMMWSDGFVKRHDHGYGNHADYRWYLIGEIEARRREPLRSLKNQLHQIQQDTIHIRYGRNTPEFERGYAEGKLTIIQEMDKEISRLMRLIDQVGEKEV